MRLAFVVLLVCATAVTAAPGSERVLAEWSFDQPGQLQGWAANAHIQNARVTTGVLAGRTVGSDPILEYQPALALTATPWQIIEVRLRVDAGGLAQVFWSNTREGRFGGFSGQKTTDFHLVGDGQWRTCRLFPFWQKEGQIVRLRLDLADGANFELDFIRILELPMPSAAPEPAFSFAQNTAGWQAPLGAQLWPTNQGLAARLTESGGFLLAPPVSFNALDRSFVVVRLAATNAREGRIFFATDQEPGLHSLAFPLNADGQAHLYNVDMLAAPAWRGRVVALGLAPTDATNTTALLYSVAALSEPQGPPRLEVRLFTVDEATPRAGVPADVVALLVNTGGSPASNLQARLVLPRGLRLLESPAPGLLQTPLGYDEELNLRWRVIAERPLTNHLTLHVTTDHSAPVQAEVRASFPPLRRSPPSAYIPPPQPIRGPYEVGVYYFPGWRTASQWQPLQQFPERKPVLGWYHEGLPEVADWHIKWAVEHGITFFAYDWYWVQGNRQLEHALHDGFFQARFRHLLKFCLLWANHNPPQTHSLEDSRAVARFWSTNYFHRPEYFRLHGKPVVIIFSPYNFRTDLGVDGTRRALDAMREECRQAGLPGLYFLACVSSPHEATGEGYDAVTCYNWAALGLASGERRGPFASLITGYQRQWEVLLTQGRLPLLTPVSGGWDSRPWHGENAMVRHDRTPELFKRHLQDARHLLDRHPARTNLLPGILIEAWNEWGEGSYIEPHKEFGFAYLDAIRDVFTSAPARHADLTPVDLGRGPYAVPLAPPGRTAWTFARDAEGWDNTMHCVAVHVAQGVLATITTGNDPALFGPPMQAQAGTYPAVRLRLRLTALDGPPLRDTAQLFWRTKRWPESESSSLRFPVQVDGQWHDYELNVAANPRWKGVITRLRLDPATRAGLRVELDEISLRR